jgi:outer membrane murein-binding lipoprotein Lpp
VTQDFHAAFGFGDSDKAIGTVDEGGVALAAIQGLNQKMEQKETEITELKARLERLEQLVIAKNGGGQ